MEATALTMPAALNPLIARSVFDFLPGRNDPVSTQGLDSSSGDIDFHLVQWNIFELFLNFACIPGLKPGPYLSTHPSAVICRYNWEGFAQKRCCSSVIMTQ